MNLGVSQGLLGIHAFNVVVVYHFQHTRYKSTRELTLNTAIQYT